MKIKKFNEDNSPISSSYIFLKGYDEDNEIVIETLFDNEKDFGNYILYNVNEIILEEFKTETSKLLKAIDNCDNWMMDQNNIPFFYEWKDAYDFINEYSDNQIFEYSECELEKNVKLDDRAQMTLNANKYNI